MPNDGSLMEVMILQRVEDALDALRVGELQGAAVLGP
jgi:hypothetical protein